MGRKKTANAGKYYTASDFDLTDLSLKERQLVFLWACGYDITEWLNERHVDHTRPHGRRRNMNSSPNNPYYEE